MECKKLMGRGGTCVEYVWTDEGEVKRRPACDQSSSDRGKRKRDEGQYRLVGTRPLTPREREIAKSCKCNRHAYQDFGFGGRMKYHWCSAKTRY